MPLAIHSNKSDALTQAIVAALLDPADFVAVRGARPDAPLKPDPAVALGDRRAVRGAAGARRRTSATRWWTCAPPRRPA